MFANRTGRWSLGAALLCLVLLAASWFLLISPRRADAAAVRAQAVESDTQAGLLTAKIDELKAEFADLPKQKAKLKAIKKQLPANATIPAFVRELQSLAAESGVDLISISPGTPAVVTSADATVATPTSGAGTLVSLPIGMVFDGDYFEDSLFLKNLQTRIDRSYLVTGIAAAPAPEPTTAATAAATPTATGTAAAVDSRATLDDATLTLTGSLFVLMDDKTTLDDVARDAAAAAKAAGRPLPSPTATAAAGTGAGTSSGTSAGTS